MQLLSPGVFREEVRRDLRVVPALSTANLALIAAFKKGPVGRPTFVASDAEFKRIFGGFTDRSRGPLTWSAYALNGGRFGYIMRLAAADAEAARASFLQDADTEILATSTGSQADVVNLTNLTTPLVSLPIAPGTVKVFIEDIKAVTSFNTGIAYDNTTTSINLVLGNRLVRPSTFSTVVDSTLYSDDGAGVIEDNLSNPVGTIDYETGAVSFTVSPSSPGTVSVSYQYHLSSRIQNEIAAREVAGATSYRGQLAQGDIITDANNDFMQFSWIDASDTPRTAEVDNAGVISGDAIGEVNLGTGRFAIFLGTNTLKPGTVLSVSYWYKRFLTAEDDGAGGFINGADPALNLAQPHAIDYETGAVSFTTVVVDGTAQRIRASYARAVQASAARDPGESGNDLRLQLTPVISSLDRTTGQYTRFNVLVQEEEDGNGQFSQIWTSASGVNLDDLTNPRHIAQVLNDDLTGPGVVFMDAPADDQVPRGLQGGTSTQDLEDGTGVAREYVSKLYSFGGRIVPGSVLVEYNSGGSPRRITDDNIGGLTGDVDGSSPASINYLTGVIQFTTADAVDNGNSVDVSFAWVPLTSVAVADFEGGTDGGALSTSDVVGPTLPAVQGGIYGFDRLEDIPLILTIPDFAGVPAVEREAIAYAEQRRDMMVLVSPPAGVNRDQAIEYRQSSLASNSDRAVMYWPWVKVLDPLSNATVLLPPHGHMAGIWARTDQVAGIQQAPAGTVYGRLQFIEGVEVALSRADLDLLSPAAINTVYRPARQPLVAYDCLTQSDNIDFRFINVRRTLDYLELLVAESLQDLVFRGLGPSLWAVASDRIRNVLAQAFRNGLLRGTSEAQAFFVKVDGENNPPAVEENGELICDWGVSVSKPGRFIRSRSRVIAVQ
jgi:hypothetical protein